MKALYGNNFQPFSLFAGSCNPKHGEPAKVNTEIRFTRINIFVNFTADVEAPRGKQQVNDRVKAIDGVTLA